MPNEARLVLPKPLLAKLESLGIYCQTWVTVERQERAQRWVLRAVESGGSVKEFGRYVAFFAADGARLEWLQKADRIGANGVHAMVVAPDALVGVDMARVGETYQVVIARHRLGKPKAEGRGRPPVESTVLFRGVDGQLTDKLRAQGLAPAFLTRGGEVKPVPAEFLEAVKIVTAGVSCSNCRHVHGLIDGARSDCDERLSKQDVSVSVPGGGVLRADE